MRKTFLTFAAAATIATSATVMGGRLNRVPHAVSPDVDLTSAPRIYLSQRETAHATMTGLLPPDSRSILNINKRLRHGEFVWDDRLVPAGPVSVRVDLDQQLISVFRSGHEIGAAVITFGAHGLSTPAGTFPILAKIRQHRSSTYDAPMPYTLRLTSDGVSIHGSDVRWGTATHGCIGLPEEFARRLFDQVEVGQNVEIRSDASA